MVRILIIFILSMFSISCDKKNGFNPKSSFGFKNLSDSYDSKTGIFMRRYHADIVSIKLYLNESEKNKILQSFYDNDFNDLPHIIDCSKKGSNPILYDKIVLDNSIKEHVYTDADNWFCSNGKKFNKIFSILSGIVMNTNEVKKLKPTDIYYE